MVEEREDGKEAKIFIQVKYRFTACEVIRHPVCTASECKTSDSEE